MADSSYGFSTFGGLNLRDAVDSVGDGCIDCLNIDLDYSGTRVRSRDGYDNLTGSAFATNGPSWIKRQDASHLLARAYTNWYSVDSAGTATNLGAELTYSAANFGTPSTTSTYYSWSPSQTVKKLVGTTTSAPTATVDGVSARAMPKGGLLAVQPTDNRLVVAGSSNSTGGPNGVASSASHVWFSDPGNAEKWSTTNYVQLTPGDGESITAMATWGGQLVIFKESRCFIFYGNSTDAAGNPVFNYRPLELPSRLAPTLFGTAFGRESGVTVGEDGVYYVGLDGLYRTTGSTPVLLSQDLYPIGTDAGAPSYFTAASGLRWNQFYAIHFHKRRIFISLAAGTLVYDIDSNNWFFWDIITPAFETWEGEDSAGLLYFGGGFDGSANHLYRFKTSFSDDDGAAIDSYYRTGFDDLGSDSEKTIHNTDLWGTGTVAHSASADFATTLGTAENVTLGSSPAVAQGRSTAANLKGNLLSQKFASVSGGAWSLQRGTHRVQYERPPGVEGS